ncbi:hypothetical protein CDAR_294621 [Caerostris darwini]|uniref:Uncharacterized protein n=1 Tax=Caerostris darwini TaxID=1538125 RepID=A0AAV4UKC1_9ARAC|nr:hypothetical protein CDAR_294621 [Caerostris darwini]
MLFHCPVGGCAVKSLLFSTRDPCREPPPLSRSSSLHTFLEAKYRYDEDEPMPLKEFSALDGLPRSLLEGRPSEPFVASLPQSPRRYVHYSPNGMFAKQELTMNNKNMMYSLDNSPRATLQ